MAWGDMVSCGCCPVTGGVPTRMTEACFSRLCREKQRAAKESADDAPYANKSAAAVRKKLNICAVCREKMRPPELEIIEKEKMMAEKQVQQCDCCGMGKNTTMCSGEMLCSTCASLAGAVTKRPADVAKMIIKRGMTAEIIEALGVDQVRSNVVELASGGTITMPSTADLAKALGLPDTAPWQVVELAALQTAALLEDAAIGWTGLPLVAESLLSTRQADSYLLDLSLMVMRGEVTGLDPEFIVSMREALT